MRKLYFLSVMIFLAGSTLIAQTWSPLGPNDVNQPAYYQADFTSIAAAPDGAIYTAYKDAGNANKLTVEKYTAGSWSLVGTAGFSSSAIEYVKIAIAPDGTPYVVFQVQNGGDIYRLDATVM